MIFFRATGNILLSMQNMLEKCKFAQQFFNS